MKEHDIDAVYDDDVPVYITGEGNIRIIFGMPEGIKKGDALYVCGCVGRDGKIWHRAKHWDEIFHPDELCPYHKEEQEVLE